jgi:hypothetical protein
MPAGLCIGRNKANRTHSSEPVSVPRKLAYDQTMSGSVECGLQKGGDGVLRLSADRQRITWTPRGTSVATFDETKTDVVKLVDGKVTNTAETLLRVQLSSGKDYIFRFASLELRLKARALFGNDVDSAEGPTRPVSAASPEVRMSSPERGETSPSPPRSRDTPIPIDVPRITFSGPTKFNTGQKLKEDDVRARSELFRKDPQLRKLHEDLVQGGLLGEEDFWIGKEDRLEQEKLLLRQKQGLSPEALIDPSLDSSVRVGPAQEVVLDMTTEMMERVFREHPEVRRKYDENVPHRMSENQFWTAYLHCKYVLGTRRSVDRQQIKRQQAPYGRGELEKRKREAAEIFGDINEYRLKFREDLESSFSKRLRSVDASIGLKSTLDDAVTVPAIAGLARSGYGLAERSESELLAHQDGKEIQRSLRSKNHVIDKEKAQQIAKAAEYDPVLTKINERAAFALASLEPTESAESEQLRRARTVEDHTNDLTLDHDLAPTPAPSVLPLKLSSGQEGTATSVKSKAKESSESGSSTQRIRLEPSIAWPKPATHFQGISESEVEAKLLRMEPKLRSISPEIRDKYLLAISTVDELCRHFWAASDDTEAHQKKRCLIVQKINELGPQIDTQLRSAMRQGSSEALPLLRLPLEQLSKAVSEHAKVCKLSHL